MGYFYIYIYNTCNVYEISIMLLNIIRLQVLREISRTVISYIKITDNEKKKTFYFIEFKVVHQSTKCFSNN